MSQLSIIKDSHERRWLKREGDGYIAEVYVGERLLGKGWHVFPREGRDAVQIRPCSRGAAMAPADLFAAYQAVMGV